ncbi:enamine deaminase RidA [Aureimonas sp. Leaf454]|uniref:RidA family protein n=1 Tax=Aureimonas sp. Leaf454 TaxID=1736381 RepID=UPI0006F48F5A|nr:RidA family protein [Aureimonas sp. Leaf454]KQT44608.1 enamine deaminase RidA [Aureimonas sp. Leaf454]
MTHQIVQPDGWAKPVGYSNGIRAKGTFVQVGGQIGWDEKGEFQSDDFVGQVEQALKNVAAVLRTAGAAPGHIVQMTWYFTDRDAYRGSLKEIGEVYRAVIGRHFPPMAAVQVVALMEDRAKVEIVATAIIPD